MGEPHNLDREKNCLAAAVEITKAFASAGHVKTPEHVVSVLEKAYPALVKLMKDAEKS